MTDMTHALLRRGFEMERDNARDNCVRAVDGATSALLAVQSNLAAGKPPGLDDLRHLAAEAIEAYQRAAAWAALERVEFMLPGADETKED